MTALSTVLVAHDFSKRADRAVRRGRMYLKDGTRLVVFHAASPTGDTNEVLRARLIGRLQQIMEPAELERTSVEIYPGPLHTVAAQLMRLHDAELLIVGLHGKKGLSDLLLTNTMARVVASIGGPTLIAKTSPPLPYRNIVVGIDFAETAAAALARAQRWFPEARICVVHAFDLRFGRRPPGPVSIQELDEQRRHWLAETVARAGAPARGQPVETLLMNGPPAQMLRKAAVDRQSDLIVLGRHNRGWLLDAILGSVVRTVLADPPCDVLVVAPEPAKAASRGA